VQVPKALIVGAGIGGLAAAVALRGAGWDVRIFERASSPRELGFALLLAPNAMHALRELGLGDAVRRGGFVMTSGEMRRPDGTVLRRFDIASVRALVEEDTICILRPVLHGALLDAVGLASVDLASPAVGFVGHPEGVHVKLADGRTPEGHLLVGADGVASVIRAQLHPGDRPPRASALLAIRGVARDVVAHLGGVSAAQYFGRGLEAGVARAGEREVYWYLSVKAAHFTDPHDAVAVAHHCAAQFHKAFRAIVRATPREELRLDELFERDPISPWGRGSVTLLGDAAHPMLPHAGQGAAQALEDAVVLGSSLRDTQDQTGIEAALRRYEDLRIPRTGAVVALARRNARMGSFDNTVGCWMRDQIVRFIPRAVILKSLVALGKPPR
jgi:2-polyprenyl-6-methoxyphenol hydroxylase-like FAD-dependent oxidoreductase